MIFDSKYMYYYFFVSYNNIKELTLRDGIYMHTDDTHMHTRIHGCL